MNPLLVLVMLAAVLSFSLGTSRLFGWVMARRDARIDAAYRSARLLAIARAEVRGG